MQFRTESRKLKLYYIIALKMNNADVDKLLDECETELAHIEGIISSLG
jgi:hypothetical protein